jgi:hypothetical protein
MLLSLFKTLCPAKRLCPLVSLALVFGCGKKINEPNISDTSNSTQNPILPTTLVIQIDEAQSPVTLYDLQKDAIFELPQKLIVKKGNGAFKKVKISYNIDIDADYEFHCFYKSTGQSDVLPIEKCEDPQGGNFGDVSEQEFAMDQGKRIEMKLTNPTSFDLIVDAVFNVKWL